MAEYIEREKAQDGLDNIDWYHVNDKGQLLPGGKSDIETYVPFKAVEEMLTSIPTADVLPRDEAIKMGAELAAMHGSDATSQQLEEAYLKGVEDGMTRRDVRPVARGKWEWNKNNGFYYCSKCGAISPREDQDGEYCDCPNYCPNCGADMREES